MNVFGNGLIDDLFEVCNQYISLEDYDVSVDILCKFLKNAQTEETKANIYLKLARCFNDKKNSH